MECAKGVAYVLTTWSLLEDRLALVLTMATATNHRRTDNGITYMPNPVAVATLEAIDRVAVRLDVLEANIALLQSPDLSSEFGRLKIEIRKLAGRRATVAHALWGVAERFPQDVIVQDGFGHYIRYTPKCFADISQAINAMCARLLDFAFSCLNAGAGDTPKAQHEGSND